MTWFPGNDVENWGRVLRKTRKCKPQTDKSISNKRSTGRKRLLWWKKLNVENKKPVIFICADSFLRTEVYRAWMTKRRRSADFRLYFGRVGATNVSVRSCNFMGSRFKQRKRFFLSTRACRCVQLRLERDDAYFSVTFRFVCRRCNGSSTPAAAACNKFSRGNCCKC